MMRRASLIHRSRRSLRTFASNVKQRLRRSVSRSHLSRAPNRNNPRVGEQGSGSHSAAPRPVPGHSAMGRHREVRGANDNAITRRATHHSNAVDCEKTKSL
ncbi:unnamed protein product [Rodentolepis nana]|uniref:Uncharacterized protein n=1 Tax=Rodentolepis nana TaxID=102285 RepID=A0A3P7VBG0_RODNA|nr:unnamed protein product [Rodentolepis nana]